MKTTPYYEQHPEVRQTDSISFTASNPLDEYTWRCPLHVLHHLLYHPQERQKLMRQAQQRSLKGPQTFSITHSLLDQPLPIGSGNLDQVFISQLEMAIFHQEERCKALNHMDCRVWKTQSESPYPLDFFSIVDLAEVSLWPPTIPFPPGTCLEDPSYEEMDEKITPDLKPACIPQ
jgi:hypothetical protein